jgi:hypothetical protein
MKLTKALGIAGALLIAALVGGTLINSAQAVDEETTVDVETRARYCETFRERFANELGVSVDELTDAGRTAALATIDEADEAGDLDAARAERLRERLRAMDGSCDDLGLGFGRGHGPGHGFGPRTPGDGPGRGQAIGVVRVAANELSLDTIELRDQLTELGSLQAVAEARGVDYATLTETILAEVTEHLEAAVADGLDQARADTILEHVTTWLADGGQLDELGGAGLGPGRGTGPADGHGRGRHGQAEGHGFGR